MVLIKFFAGPFKRNSSTVSRVFQVAALASLCQAIALPGQDTDKTNAEILAEGAGGAGMPPFYVAIGDSYPAGTGAGNTLTNEWNIPGCHRTDGSYPWQIHNRFYNKPDPAGKDTEFSFHACNGHNTGNVDGFQIDGFGTEKATLITVQVGGNDVGFANIVRSCVYWVASGCDKFLADSRKAMDSPQFQGGIDRMLGHLEKAAPKALRFFLGYASFFNQEAKGQSWLPNYCRTEPKVRKEINDLVLHLNDVLRPLVEKHGAYFIDPNPAFNGHRFCDTGDQYFQYYTTFQDGVLGLFHPSPKGHGAYADLVSIARTGRINEKQGGEKRSENATVTEAFEA